jgi:ABC-type lipoprotein export system ATPase subunit
MQVSKQFQQTKSVPVRPLFALDQVSQEFGQVRALKQVSLQILPKEILFLTGASGSGKTTLLNILAGLLNPTMGKISLPQFQYEDHFCAQVFQDLRLIHKMTVEENLWVSFDKAIHDNKNNFYKEMTELSKILGVYDFLHKKIDECNGGTKQKLAMIRALLSHPHSLLADEPTSSLDKDNTFKLFELLNHYNHKRGLTIVWATHNRDLIKTFPGKIAHLDQGRLVYSGSACFI